MSWPTEEWAALLPLHMAANHYRYPSHSHCKNSLIFSSRCTFIHCRPNTIIYTACSIPAMNNKVPPHREDFLISTFLPCTSVILSVVENPHPPIFPHNLHTPPTPQCPTQIPGWSCFITTKHPGASSSYLMALVTASPLAFISSVDKHQILLRAK